MVARQRLLLLTTLVLLGPNAAEAEPPPEAGKAPSLPRPVHADLHGDPLPDGVVSRLGTERLIASELADFTFSADGKRVAYNDREDLCVWEVSSGKQIST
jgi:hypothetical protein